jgi:hypothetical protein
MKSGLTLAAFAACVAVLGAAVLSGFGGGTGKVEQQVTLSPECGAAINAFRPRVMTAALYVISGSQTGSVVGDLYVRTVQVLSRRRLYCSRASSSSHPRDLVW